MFEEILSLFLGETPDLLTSITLLLVAILRNLTLLRIVIKKTTKTENQKILKHGKTPVLDTKKLFKQTARKSIGFRLLAMVIAVEATYYSSFIADMLYDLNQKLTWYIEFFGSLGYVIRWAIITFPTVCGIMMYLFNKKWTFSGTELTLEQKKKISRYLAFFSFPHVIIRPLVILSTIRILLVLAFITFILYLKFSVWRKS